VGAACNKRKFSHVGRLIGRCRAVTYVSGPWVVADRRGSDSERGMVDVVNVVESFRSFAIVGTVMAKG
jgi:hypothetical protein